MLNVHQCMSEIKCSISFKFTYQTLAHYTLSVCKYKLQSTANFTEISLQETINMNDNLNAKKQ